MLEIHVCNQCNMYCEGCSHFSNFQIPGIFSAKELYEWSLPWSSRIYPKEICLLGGEPLINRDLINVIKVHRELWPTTSIILFTNGLLLKKWKDTELPKTLSDCNIVLNVSNHTTYDSDQYDKKMIEVRKLAEKLSTQYGFEFNYYLTSYTKRQDDQKNLYVDYDNPLNKSDRSLAYNDWLVNDNQPRNYSNWIAVPKKPFNSNDYHKSWWYTCGRREIQCWQLYHGKIYKCSPLAYLNDLDKKVGGLGKEWKMYLKYKPLEPNCSDQELKNFLVPKADPECSMCPAFDYQPKVKQGNPLKYKPYIPIIKKS